MPSTRPTDIYGPVRSRLLTLAAYLRARPVHVFGTGAVIVLALLLPFHFIDRQEQFIGMPAAITSLAVVAAALVGGPRVGAGLAVLGGVTYDTLVVTDRWLASGITTAAVLIVWILAGLAAGLLGDRYRGQVARSIDQAHRSRDALDRVVEATPSFHARGSAAAVARAICDAARRTFDCDLAALFAIEADRLRLLARSPFLANDGERLAMEPSRELQHELADNLLPMFVADVRVPGGPRVPRAITGDADQVSAVRAPVLLDDEPVALLAMSWSKRIPEPDLSELGVVQRFVEHAAVALAQAQRGEAQSDVAALHRRFQASLVPAVDVSLPGVGTAAVYRPGEQRMLLGGDFVDTVLRPDGSLAAVIGDVTGHGPDSAALGSSLRAAWRALMLSGADPAETMGTLNSLTLDESDRSERADLGSLLATVCALVLEGSGIVRLVVAGHPTPLLLGRGAGPIDHRAGPLLGLGNETSWPVTTVALPGRWGLLLYTDGIIEARTAPGSHSRLRIEGLAERVTLLWADGGLAKADLDRLVDDVEAAQGGPLPDDVTLLALTGGDPYAPRGA